LVSAMASEPDRVAREIVQSMNKLGLAASFGGPTTIVGRSGIRHSFSFSSMTRGRTRIVGDIVFSSGPIEETTILSLYIKVYDVGAKHAIFCALPSVTPEAKKLSDLYGITVVESSDKERFPEMVSKAAQRLLKAG
jgi:hypothetical protein